jgi:tRNA pseudouridine32 synthase / 23S rRNA pseudouridine746 synthase
MPSFDPGDLPRRILHRDDAMLVLDKPAGIAVHKGAGYGDNLEAHFEALRFEKPQNPALAHRLDKDTSGCLVLGRDKPALARLGDLFRKGLAQKIYWAVVVGRDLADSGAIDAPLMRRSHDKRSWWMKVDPAGDASLTRWRVLGKADGLLWLELTPETGRTHQLRVHCAHLGTPIAGDHIYGGDLARSAARHMHLHARSITLPVYRASPVHVTAPAPQHMYPLLEACGWRPDAATVSPADMAELPIPSPGQTR